MPYNPGISYHGDQYLYKGITGGVDKAVEGFTKASLENQLLRSKAGAYAQTGLLTAEQLQEFEKSNLAKKREIISEADVVWGIQQQQLNYRQKELNYQNAAERAPIITGTMRAQQRQMEASANESEARVPYAGQRAASEAQRENAAANITDFNAQMKAIDAQQYGDEKLRQQQKEQLIIQSMRTDAFTRVKPRIVGDDETGKFVDFGGAKIPKVKEITAEDLKHSQSAFFMDVDPDGKPYPYRLIATPDGKVKFQDLREAPKSEALEALRLMLGGGGFSGVGGSGAPNQYAQPKGTARIEVRKDPATGKQYEIFYDAKGNQLGHQEIQGR